MTRRGSGGRGLSAGDKMGLRGVDMGASVLGTLRLYPSVNRWGLLRGGYRGHGKTDRDGMGLSERAGDGSGHAIPPLGVPCTTVVQMPKHTPSKTSSDSAHGGTRLSVTLPADHYREMQGLATRKKVSMAWVMRDAVDQYLATHGEPGARAGSSRKSHPPASGKGGA